MLSPNINSEHMNRQIIQIPGDVLIEIIDTFTDSDTAYCISISFIEKK